MNALPSSIEVSLVEAGFSGTEILILKRLLEERAMTLRQLAAKTGKSTGVLDQAMKKLTKKKIVTREMINGSPKFVLESMQAIVRWMHEDTVRKREVLLRKYQDFESFISTLDVSKDQPEMEYFNGLEGVQRAYEKLLELPGVTEILRYAPVLWKEEEDPLRDFRVQWFRERRSRGLFSRVIAYDTPLGHRFQSRDPFEYRRTVLVREGDTHIGFEKIVAGDVVACINLKETRACFLRYPELAAEERVRFEQLWRNAQKQPSAPGEAAPPPVPAPPTRADTWTKIVSGLREFFLNPKSLVAIGVLGLLSAGMTYGMYMQNVAMNMRRIQEKVVAVAATATPLFSAEDVEEIRSPADTSKPAYQRIVFELGKMRNRNNGLKYAYIMRPTDDANTWEFVADVDFGATGDVNGDGKIDQLDENAPPGEQYDVTGSIPPVSDALIQPTAFTPFTDKWGTWIAGWAPIRDKNGQSIAILGVDIDANEIYSLSNTAFTPLFTFFALLILFLLVRFFAFNRSLYEEILKVFNLRLALLSTTFFCLLIVVGIMWLKHLALQERKREAGERLMAIAATAASQFDPADLQVLRLPRDMHREEYQRVFRQLNEIRGQNLDIKYAYIWRPTEQEGIWEFVADADSNFYLPSQDFNLNGYDAADENSPPGTRYDLASYSSKLDEMGFKMPLYILGSSDQWGSFITATAPVYDKIHRPVAILGIDQDIDGL